MALHWSMQDLVGAADNPIILDDGDEEEDGYAYENEGKEVAAEEEEEEEGEGERFALAPQTCTQVDSG